jgi:hypothetical protein
MLEIYQLVLLLGRRVVGVAAGRLRLLHTALFIRCSCLGAQPATQRAAGLTHTGEAMRGWLATGVLVVALVACGDDDDNSIATTAATTVAVTTESTTPDSKIDSTIASTVGGTPSSSNTTDDETAAQDALLQLSDFPSGWTEQPVRTTDENVETQRKWAECIGSDRPRINDLGGASSVWWRAWTPRPECKSIEPTMTGQPDTVSWRRCGR